MGGCCCSAWRRSTSSTQRAVAAAAARRCSSQEKKMSWPSDILEVRPADACHGRDMGREFEQQRRRHGGAPRAQLGTSGGGISRTTPAPGTHARRERHSEQRKIAGSERSVARDPRSMRLQNGTRIFCRKYILKVSHDVRSTYIFAPSSRAVARAADRNRGDRVVCRLGVVAGASFVPSTARSVLACGASPGVRDALSDELRRRRHCRWRGCGNRIAPVAVIVLPVAISACLSSSGRVRSLASSLPPARRCGCVWSASPRGRFRCPRRAPVKEPAVPRATRRRGDTRQRWRPLPRQERSTSRSARRSWRPFCSLFHP